MASVLRMAIEPEPALVSVWPPDGWLNQPESIGPAKVARARADETERLEKHHVYDEFPEEDYDPILDGEIDRGGALGR